MQHVSRAASQDPLGMGTPHVEIDQLELWHTLHAVSRSLWVQVHMTPVAARLGRNFLKLQRDADRLGELIKKQQPKHLTLTEDAGK